MQEVNRYLRKQKGVGKGDSQTPRNARERWTELLVTKLEEVDTVFIVVIVVVVIRKDRTHDRINACAVVKKCVLSNQRPQKVHAF